ncbi:MAG: adenylosuccinate synthase [Nanoarchaeota archaeon]
MPVTVVLGGQWGDEGKGKIVDILAADCDVVCRATGGNNAGHTIVINGEKTILHLVPSGILHPSKLNIMGNGMVIDPEVLLQEFATLQGKGIVITPNRLVISSKAHVILDYHKQMEKLGEGKRIGTTGRGIGPCYADKAYRLGIRMADFVDDLARKRMIARNLEQKNVLFRDAGLQEMDVDELDIKYAPMAKTLLPLVVNTTALVHELLDAGKNLLVEGAQGLMLDIDHGTYPYVTSSNASIGGVCSGLGIPPGKIDRVVGIIKAYTTRVGEGPFPTELLDDDGEKLRIVGGEFGSTTGRPRRCGWFDGVVARHSCQINGSTDIALTKLDVLDGFSSIKVCTGYDGLMVFPSQSEDASKVKTDYKEFAGWGEDITAAKTIAELPEKAKEYISVLEKLMKVKISMVSVGPGRAQTILR